MLRPAVRGSKTALPRVPGDRTVMPA
jgi:hypothetical protein